MAGQVGSGYLDPTRPDPRGSGPDPTQPDPTRPDPRVDPTREQLWLIHKVIVYDIAFRYVIEPVSGFQIRQ